MTAAYHQRIEREYSARLRAEQAYQRRMRLRHALWLPIAAVSLPFVLLYAVGLTVWEHFTS